MPKASFAEEAGHPEAANAVMTVHDHPALPMGLQFGKPLWNQPHRDQCRRVDAGNLIFVGLPAVEEKEYLARSLEGCDRLDVDFKICVHRWRESFVRQAVPAFSITWREAN